MIEFWPMGAPFRLALGGPCGMYWGVVNHANSDPAANDAHRDLQPKSWFCLGCCRWIENCECKEPA